MLTVASKSFFCYHIITSENEFIIRLDARVVYDNTPNTYGNNMIVLYVNNTKQYYCFLIGVLIGYLELSIY